MTLLTVISLCIFAPIYIAYLMAYIILYGFTIENTNLNVMSDNQSPNDIYELKYNNYYNNKDN